ncbi:hypothetical protein AC1031_021114 [Aphanomyces cochlioides]|nr:hypothetical protein AC1031_021114 [Aphanomyces cochlioides]
MKKVLRKTSALLRATKRENPSYDVLDKMSVPASQLLIELLRYVDLECMDEEGLYRRHGPPLQVEELNAAFHHHLSTAAAFPDLRMYNPHAITSTIKNILQEYQSLVPHGVSKTIVELVDEVKVTPEVIAKHFVKIPATNRDTLRVLLRHLKQISEAKILRMDVSSLAQCVGILLVRPSRDNQANNIRSTLKRRQKIARKLIRGAESWPYDCATELDVESIPDAKGAHYGMKLAWNSERVQYTEAQLRSILAPYGSLVDLAMHPTDTKARASIQLKHSIVLDKFVVALQKKTELRILHLQVLSEHDVDELIGETNSSLQKFHGLSTAVPNSVPEDAVVVQDVLSGAEDEDVRPVAEQVEALNFTAPMELPLADKITISQDLPPKTSQCSKTLPSEHEKITIATQTTTFAVSSLGEDQETQTPRLEYEERTTQTTDDFTIEIQLNRVIQVLKTTTSSAASSSDETVRAMHQAQLQVLRMLEAMTTKGGQPDVFDTEYSAALAAHTRAKTKLLEAEVLAAQELLRMNKAQFEKQTEAWEVDMTSLRMIAAEAEKQSMEMRQQLRQVRSELACHLATMVTLNREKASLQEKLLEAEANQSLLEKEVESNKLELINLQDVAAKAQLRVEAMKATSVPLEESCETEQRRKPTSALDHLTQIKLNMSDRLQVQIEQTKAAINAMSQQDAASLHLAHQQETLETLMTTLADDQTRRIKASDKALEASRLKLKQLYDPSNPITSSPPIAPPAWINPVLNEYSAKAGPRLSKSNPESLNAARLSLHKFHQVIGSA